MLDPVTYTASRFAVSVVGVFLKPTLEKYRQKFDTKADLIIDLLTNSFSDYLKRLYEKYTYMPTLVFPNQKTLTKDLYLPLTLNKVGNEAKQYRVEGIPSQLLDNYKDVLIVDTAGMGKSTIVKYMFLQAIENSLGIPLVIELRKLGKSKTIIDLIYEEVNGISSELNKPFLIEIVERGDFIFFLDGYDEISLDAKAEVTNELQTFKTKANNNKFVLTSRDEPGLAAFSDFQRFNIQPLTESEAFELIRKYSANDQTVADALIERLGQEDHQAILEFLENPLLVSLLYKSFEYKPTVPLKKSVFYRQVYDALFENHDFSKGGAFGRNKRSALDIDQFHSVLRALGFLTYKAGKTELDRDEILQVIDKAKRYYKGLDFVSSDFLADLVNQVPLLVRDGICYRWSHKSIQEYFAACFICMDKKGDQLVTFDNLYKSDKAYQHVNMLMLCCDLDQKSFFRTIVANIANDFIKNVDELKSALGGNIDEDKIIRRAEATAFKGIVFCDTSTIDLPNSPASNMSDPRSLLHIDAMTYAMENGNRISGNSRSTFTKPVGLVVCDHQLAQLVRVLANRPDVEFIKNTDRVKDLSIVVEMKQNNRLLLLSGDINCPYNKLDIYDRATAMIIEHSEYILDYAEALNFINQTNNEILADSTGDYDL